MGSSKIPFFFHILLVTSSLVFFPACGDGDYDESPDQNPPDPTYSPYDPNVPISLPPISPTPPSPNLNYSPPVPVDPLITGSPSPPTPTFSPPISETPPTPAADSPISEPNVSSPSPLNQISTPPPPKTCPRDPLTFSACRPGLLNIVGNILGNSCCRGFEDLADAEAAACVCVATKANIFGVAVDFIASITRVFSFCGLTLPDGFSCS